MLTQAPLTYFCDTIVDNFAEYWGKLLKHWTVKITRTNTASLKIWEYEKLKTKTRNLKQEGMPVLNQVISVGNVWEYNSSKFLLKEDRTFCNYLIFKACLKLCKMQNLIFEILNPFRSVLFVLHCSSLATSFTTLLPCWLSERVSSQSWFE